MSELPRSAATGAATREDFDVWADVAAEWTAYAEGLVQELDERHRNVWFPRG